MGLTQRLDLYRQIEEHRRRPLIVYVTSKRAGLSSSMSTDALPCLIEQIDALPEKTQAIDFMIASYGGDPMVAWRISTLLRQKAKDVAVLVPQSAYSAATLVALGGNEIIMHPHSHLGPVDMQITVRSPDGSDHAKQFSTEDISAFLDFVRDNLKITDQEHVRALFEATCAEVGTLGIGFVARSSKLAVELGESLLALHMKEDERSKIRSIVENMSRKFQSHAYPVSREQAMELGLPVRKERDSALEKMMWSAWLDVEDELKERTPFDPIIELLNSSQAPKLLEPVPQLTMPMASSSIASYSTTLADVKGAVLTDIDPVDFELTYALVESTRVSRRHHIRGKLLACRTPDLEIRYNMLVTSRLWEQTSVPDSSGETK